MIFLTSDAWYFATSNEWFVATSKKRISQRLTRDILELATFATINEWTLQWVTSNFLQRVSSTTSKERIFQRVTSDFLQRATSATSNEWFFATSNFCNE